MTNADRIRQMDDEQLAELLRDVKDRGWEFFCDAVCNHCRDANEGECPTHAEGPCDPRYSPTEDDVINWLRLEEIKGNEGKISPVWHTGTPTEEGWYLVQYEDIDKTFFVAWSLERFGEELRPRMPQGTVAWQRIDEYKEESNG